MTVEVTPQIPPEPQWISVERYLALVERGVEVLREPDRARARYGWQRFARAGERVETLAAPGKAIAIRDLLPALG
jgi:hypothetical protein